jgi:hypothetical protein
MDAQTLLRTNGIKPGELAEAFGGAAGAVAKAIEETAGPLAELIETRAGMLAKSVEGRATPLAEAVGTTMEALAKTVETRAVPLAEAVGGKMDVLADDLGTKLEQARKGVAASAKDFRFGRREGLILGATVGVFAAVWLIRKMDREAAAARLRAAGTRVGEATQTVTARAGALAGQAGERAGQVVQSVSVRAADAVQRVRGQGEQGVEEARLRLSEGTGTSGDNGADGANKREDFAAGLDKETRAAIEEAVGEVEQVEAEAREQARELGLSNGMKVVAFDGTDIGRVQEVREDVFVLDRPKGSDLLVPLTEVARIEGTVAYLRIDVGQVTKMGWEKA